MTRFETIDAKSALTPTGGFLRGFTHSFSPAIGCLLGATSCGIACYAQFLPSRREGESWGESLVVKRNAPAVLRADLERASRRDPSHRHHVSKLRVFSASSTEPIVGPLVELYRECLRVVADFPIAAWVIQTRSPLVRKLRPEIEALTGRVVVSLTIETDEDRHFDLGAPGSPTIAARRAALEEMSAWGVPLHAAVSPAMPIGDVDAFADWLAARARFVTVDTFVAGDGTGSGARTARTRLPELLAARGVDWRDESQPRALFDALRARIGARAGWSQEGFRRLASITA